MKIELASEDIPFIQALCRFMFVNEGDGWSYACTWAKDKTMLCYIRSTKMLRNPVSTKDKNIEDSAKKFFKRIFSIYQTEFVRHSIPKRALIEPLIKEASLIELKFKQEKSILEVFVENSSEVVCLGYIEITDPRCTHEWLSFLESKIQS